MKGKDEVDLLIGEVAHRDMEAFTTLYEQMQETIYRIGYEILKDAQLAEDAVQETMTAVLLHADSFHEGNGSGWIARIAYNKSKTMLCRRSKEKMVDISGLDEYEEAVLNKSCTELPAVDTESAVTVKDLLGKLDKPERTVFFLKQEGYTIREIREKTGLTVRRISYLYQKAKSRLAEEIK